MAFQQSKCDPELGLQIEKHLTELGIHTPTVKSKLDVTDSEKVDIITELTTAIWKTMGMDLSDDSLCDTPRRIGKMLVKELNWGLKPENFPKCTAIENKMQVDEMVCESGVTIMSTCEHHGVTIDGRATIAYIPKEKVLGLSKMNRIAEYFSRRPQVQERLTVQIAEALKFILGTDDVAVHISAEHYCVKSRGVEDGNSVTDTVHLGGVFKADGKARAEFIAIANRG